MCRALQARRANRQRAQQQVSRLCAYGRGQEISVLWKGIDRYVYALSRYEQADSVYPQPLHDGERGGAARRQIAAEAEVTGQHLDEKPVTLAIDEVAQGQYVSDPVIEEEDNED